MKPELVLLQNLPSTETRMIRLACLTDDIPTVNVSLNGIDAYRRELRSGLCLPVGSVEFVRSAMQASGITEPENISYPEGAQRFLGRQIRRTKAGQVVGRHFVKPLTTKAFTGFVFDTLADDNTYSDADLESFKAFLAMPADAPVWISEPVEFLSEWRYYVQQEKVIGSARYDPTGAEDAPAPDLDVVWDCIRATGISHPFAVDFGVLPDTQTALVEFNDAWSLGLYQNALSPAQYLDFLHARWQSLINLS